MSALALSFAFFLFLTGLGRALFALCGWRGGILRSWLLAPALGLGTIVLAIMVLNQAGLPVRTFAWPLTLALAAAAALIFWWRRPVLPFRALIPFVGVVVFSLFWTGWPALRFNFGWLSYVNDDYVNYCLAAERFKDFSFWRVPTMEELAGRDIAQYYWFMHVPGLMRFGSEHTLAWVASLAGRSSLEIFMPVIVGLGMIQIFAAAGLALHRGRWRKRALIGAALLAASPLFMLGTLYQLIAQVGGLGLLLATTAIITTRLPQTRRRLIPHVLVASIFGASLAIFYPEVSSFPVFTLIAVGIVEWWRHFGALPRSSATPVWRRIWPTAQRIMASFPATRLNLVIYACIGAIVLLRYNVLSYLYTIILQLGSGFRTVDLSLSLFPYFLIPTGLANLFGLMPLATNFPEPFTSLAILAGAFALVTVLAFAVRESFRPNPIALLLVVQFGLTLYLLYHGNDFGLYKAAMWMQPALTAALACLLVKLPRVRWTAPLAVALAAALCAPTALHYTRASEGEKGGGLTEAKFASILGTQPPVTPPHTRLLCDISNLVAAKVAALHLRGTDLRFLSRDYYQQIAPIEFERLGDRLVSLHPHFDDLARTHAMQAERDAATIRTHTLFLTEFRAPALSFAKNDPYDSYLSLDETLGLFNKFHLAVNARPVTYFKEQPAATTHNHLVFMHSGRGNHYYLGDRNRIAMYQQEADTYSETQDFTGIGRFMLLRVEQPDKEFYLRIAATKTFLGRGHTAWSPKSSILGEGDVPLAFPGNGAVNRIVGPIRPQWRDGAAYIAIDFNETAIQYLPHRTGLQSLYNTDIPLDSRKLVAYGRDISVLSTEEVAALARPSRLARFPADLVEARGLEFSGIYEDGWLSPESEFVLSGAADGGCVRLRGVVPALPDTALGAGSLALTLNGRQIELPAAKGAFDWLIPMPAAASTSHLSLHFSTRATLPQGDDRPVGGRLELIEVLKELPTHSFDYGTPGDLRLASTGIDQDGWMAGNATLELPANLGGDIELRVEFPDWSGAKESSLRAQLSGSTESATHSLVPGQYSTIHFPVPYSASPRTLRLEIPTEFSLPGPDGRRRAGRLTTVKIDSRPRG